MDRSQFRKGKLSLHPESNGKSVRYCKQGRITVVATRGEGIGQTRLKAERKLRKLLG